MGSWIHTANRIDSRSPWHHRNRSRRPGQVLTRNRPGCHGLVVERFRGGYARLGGQVGQVSLLWRSPNSSRHNCVTVHAIVRTQTSILKEVGELFWI